MTFNRESRTMKKMHEMIRWPGAVLGTMLTASVSLASQASAQGAGDAEKLLKAMADYVAGAERPSPSPTIPTSR